MEGDRGTKTVPDVGKHLVFSYLTTDARHDVSLVHSDAAPVCLFNEAARDDWRAPLGTRRRAAASAFTRHTQDCRGRRKKRRLIWRIPLDRTKKPE
jgi:hypothetical protein